MSPSPYAQINTRQTPQTQPILGRKMVLNNAKGYVFQLDDWKAFERFLILGSEGGTFYVGEQKLTVQNAERTLACIREDGKRAVNAIVAISDSGRAAKNDPAIFALALAAAAESPETRAFALAALPRVARIPTHLFHFLEYSKGLRGWGRELKRAVASWYADKPVDQLAYLMTKYQQRDGWRQADVLRKSHPHVAGDGTRDLLYKWAVDGYEAALAKQAAFGDRFALPSIVGAFEQAKDAPTNELCDLIREHNLSREMIPTNQLTKPEVWEALLEKMNPEALLRNLGNLSKIGLLVPFSDASKAVVAKLGDCEQLKRKRIHPLQVLIALKVYSSGRGFKGDGKWDPVPGVVDTLDSAFYSCFDYLTQGQERLLIAIDCSGSMTGARLGCAPNFSAAEASAAMAMACVRASKETYTIAFDDQVRRAGDLSPRSNLKEVMKTYTDLSGNGTDCSIPVVYALERKLNVDGIIQMTDGETWAGKYHVCQALRTYRDRFNPHCKHVAVGMTATNFSINSPEDMLSADFAGFDASVPQAIQSFLRLE